MECGNNGNDLVSHMEEEGGGEDLHLAALRNNESMKSGDEQNGYLAITERQKGTNRKEHLNGLPSADIELQEIPPSPLGETNKDTCTLCINKQVEYKIFPASLVAHNSL